MNDSKSDKKQKDAVDLASLKRIFAPLLTFLKRHFSFIFTGVALLALVYVVLTVQVVLQQTPSSDASAATSSEYSTSFDQDTIKKINLLGDRQNTTDITFPAGRINPFSE